MHIRFVQKSVLIVLCCSFLTVQQVDAAASSSTDQSSGPVRALFRAVKHRDAESVVTLLHTGVSPNALAHDSFESPLQVAARAGSPKVVKLLIDAGADVNYCSESGNALHAALDPDEITEGAYYYADKKVHLIAYHLIKAGIDVAVKNAWGQAPMDLACRWANFQWEREPKCKMLTNAMLVILQLLKENPIFEVRQLQPELYSLIGGNETCCRVRTELLSRALATADVHNRMGEMALLLSLGADADSAQCIIDRKRLAFDRETLLFLEGQTPLKLLPRYIDLPTTLLPAFEKMKRCSHEIGLFTGLENIFYCPCSEEIFRFFARSTDAMGRTPLHIAATVDFCDGYDPCGFVTMLMMSAPETAYAKNSDGLTPSELAIAHGHPDRAALIDRDKKWWAREKIGEAIRTQQVAKYLSPGGLLHCLDEEGKREALNEALCEAAIRDDLLRASEFLSLGADINYDGYCWGGSSIRWAIRNRSLRMVRLLLGEGRKITDRNVLEMFFGSLPPSESGCDGYDSDAYAKIMIDLLVDGGVDVNVEDFFHHTPLYRAATMRGLSEQTVRYIIDKLIAAGARPEVLSLIDKIEISQKPHNLTIDVQQQSFMDCLKLIIEYASVRENNFSLDSVRIERVPGSLAEVAHSKGFHERAAYLETCIAKAARDEESRREAD